jgi:hypothetical protein
VILGVIWILIFQIRSIPLMHLGAAPDIANVTYLLGGRQALGAWLLLAPTSIMGTLQFFFLLLGLKMVFEFLLSLIKLKMPKVTEGLAAIVFIAIFALPSSLGSNHVAIEMPAQILVYAIAVLIVYRFGLVPLAVAIFTVDTLGNIPFSADFSAWYMPTSILALLSVVALAGWGFYHSLGGEPIWQPEIE